MNIDSIFKKYPINKFALLVFVITLIFYFEKKIIDFVRDYLLTDFDFSNIILDSVFFIFILVLAFYFAYIIIIKEYIPSLFQKVTIVGIVIVLFYFNEFNTELLT